MLPEGSAEVEEFVERCWIHEGSDEGSCLELIYVPFSPFYPVGADNVGC